MDGGKKWMYGGKNGLMKEMDVKDGMESGFTISSTVVHEHTILQSYRVNMRCKE